MLCCTFSTGTPALLASALSISEPSKDMMPGMWVAALKSSLRYTLFLVSAVALRQAGCHTTWTSVEGVYLNGSEESLLEVQHHRDISLRLHSKCVQMKIICQPHPAFKTQSMHFRLQAVTVH